MDLSSLLDLHDIIFIIMVVIVVYRLYEGATRGDRVPEELQGEASPEVTESDFIQVFDESRARAILDLVSNKLDDAHQMSAILNSHTHTYEEIIQDILPSLKVIGDELLLEIKELKLEARSIEANLNESSAESLTDLQIDRLQTLKFSCQQLIAQLSTLSELYEIMPKPNRLREAYMLIKHDLSPFMANRHASLGSARFELIPLPSSKRTFGNDLRRHFGDRLSFYFANLEHLDEPSLWPLFAQETPQLLEQRYPEWTEEWTSWCEGKRAIYLPNTHRRSLQWRVEDSLNAWADDLLSAYLVTLRYGPAGTRALIEELERSDGLDHPSLTKIGSQRGKPDLQSTVAPPVIYVEASLQTLRLNGYLREADIIESQWRSAIGDELQVLIRGGKYISFPAQLILAEVKLWIERLNSQPWKSWRDEPLSAMLGLSITRGQWSSIEEHAQQLVESDGSLVLPESIRWVTFAHCVQKSPQMVGKVLRAAEQYHYSDQSFRSDQPVSIEGSSRDDIIAALVLPDLLLQRPRGLASRRA